MVFWGLFWGVSSFGDGILGFWGADILWVLRKAVRVLGVSVKYSGFGVLIFWVLGFSGGQCEVHEVVAVGYYESGQNVAPIFDARHVADHRDEKWRDACMQAWEHFEAACAIE